MNQIENIESEVLTYNTVYFIGIGGIGMSAIARYFHSIGSQVLGYDKTRTQLTRELEKMGMIIHYTDDVNLIPKHANLIIYTPAIPKDHAELNYYLDNQYQVLKRSDVLKLITDHGFNICVAGTHGKTTTSTMIAHVLKHSNFGCNAFLGGISSNYNTNFWSSEKKHFVVEADEFDRSFLKLKPNIAVITSMDADHLDIYGTVEELEKTFIEFSSKIKEGGTLIYKYGLKHADQLKGTHKISYSFNNSNADVYISELIIQHGSYCFNVISSNWVLTNITLNMGGLHNIDNIIASIIVAKLLNIDDEKIRNAVAEFKGVKRRFEYILKEDEHVLIDDYAHHPEELKALIAGVRSLFKDPLVLAFQPHLFSRTKDFADEFASVLSTADEVILLPIYPAREKPIEGVNSEMILNKMNLEKNQLLEKEEFLEYIKKLQPSLLVMAGAGDIDVLVEPIKQILEEQ